VIRPDQPRSEKMENGAAAIRVGELINGDTPTHRQFLHSAISYALTVEEKPDVILFVSLDLSLISEMKKLRRAGIATLYVSTMARGEDSTRSLKSILSKYLQLKLYSQVDRIVCSTSELKRDMATLGLSESQMLVIYNGVALERFKPLESSSEINALRKKLSIPLDEPVATYIGLMVDRKAVIELVEGWKLYKQNGGKGYLLLVGDEKRDIPDTAEFYQKWDQIIANLEPEHKVLRKPPSTKIEDYYRASDLFVFMSRLEGMPNVIPESMACGLPVLTAKFIGFSEDFGVEGRDLVTTERTPEALAEKLTELLSNSFRLKELAKNGRLWVEEHQSVEKSLDKYVALFHEIKHNRGNLAR
ncbi:glycosyltransferase family 4 protein, partial [Calditrichota bacterium]